MTDGPIETVVEPVNDAVDDLSSEETPPTHEDRPSWVDEIISRVEAVGDAITANAPNPLNTEEVPTPGETVEELHDQSPVREPWTHRGPFKRKD